MKWIGLSGGLGCGKSVVTEIIRKQGYPVVDADRIVHHLYESDESLKKSLLKEFGNEILSEQKISREKISDILKLDISKKTVLENLIHPLVQNKVQEIRDRLKRNQAKMAFYDVPLLFENKMQKNFDATVFINAPLDLIYERLLKRNQWSKQEVDTRMSWLLPNSTKVQLADHVIENDSSIENLEVKVVALLDLLYQE